MMDRYFPDDEGDETGLGDAQVDEQGAFALSNVQAPQGGFSFVRTSSRERNARSWLTASLPQGNMS